MRPFVIEILDEKPLNFSWTRSIWTYRFYTNFTISQFYIRWKIKILKKQLQIWQVFKAMF